MRKARSKRTICRPQNLRLRLGTLFSLPFPSTLFQEEMLMPILLQQSVVYSQEDGYIRERKGDKKIRLIWRTVFPPAKYPTLDSTNYRLSYHQGRLKNSLDPQIVYFVRCGKITKDMNISRQTVWLIMKKTLDTSFKKWKHVRNLCSQQLNKLFKDAEL